ncbi:MAG: AAA family ATPase [bacterium]
MRFFNTAGPVNPRDHYTLPFRIDREEIYSLIRQKKYFMLHAPRQTGKTTGLLELVNWINQEEERYKALYVNVETAQAAREKVEAGIEAILREFQSGVRWFLGKDASFPNVDELLRKGAYKALSALLEGWAEASHQQDGRHLVIFIDEIDSLVGDTLLSVLRQLRSGYLRRPDGFPQSIGLVGVRDVRDYRIFSSVENAVVLGGSAFNIKAESIRLQDFSYDEVAALYRQHTEETGQVFTPEAIERAFYWTQGQPWLVNALAYQAAFRDVKDRAVSITADHIEAAKETLIQRRDTHLDVLIDRLEEKRVRQVIEPLLTGDDAPEHLPIDDILYVRDLGLIKAVGHQIEIANPLYGEVVPREMVWSTQQMMAQDPAWYVRKDGSLDMSRLLEAFQAFFREHSQAWLERFAYKEAGPHLLLMAFLQRIVNTGGQIFRGYGLGRKRMDILVVWKGHRYALELKVRRGEQTKEEGLAQLDGYMDTSRAEEGHLLLFDRRPGRTWEEKIYRDKAVLPSGRTALVWGM